MRDKIIIQANIHVSNAGSDNIDRDINSSRKGLSTMLSSQFILKTSFQVKNGKVIYMQ